MKALAAIHVAKKHLGLDDDTYRGLLARVTGKHSTRDMSEAERGRVLDELRRLGFEPASKPARRGLEGPYAAKLQALWIAAWNLGIVRDRSDKALTAFVRRQTGIEAARWLRYPEDAARVIEALKGWMAREGGVDWSAPRRGAPAHFADDRFRIVRAQIDRLGKLGQPVEPGTGWRLTGKDFADYDSVDWMRVMNALGQRIRAAKAEAGR